MGEIAEMMLDGTMCQQCGVYLDDDGDGIPAYCSSCAPREDKPKPTGPFFALKHKGHLAGLNQFLAGIHYTYYDGECKDKKGNPMFRLHYDRYPEKDHVWGVEKRGIVVCMDRGLAPLVEKAVKHHQKGK